MAQQISKGITFSTYPGLNSQVTADLINKHVDDATLLPGAISSQASSSSVPAASELLVLNSASSSLNRISVQNMIQNAAPTAAVGTKGVVQIGDGINVTTDGVISYTAPSAATGMAATICSIIVPSAASGSTINIVVNITGLSLTTSQTYTVTLKPKLPTEIGNSYSFIFGVRQITVDSIDSQKAYLVIQNIPNEITSLISANIYLELIGTAGLVTPSAGDGITVVQQTVGLTSQPVMKLTPATTASIGGVIIGNGLSISSNGVISNTITSGIKTTCYTPAAGSASTNYTHTLSGKCNVVEAIIIGGGGAGGAGAVITGTGIGARYGGGGGGGGAITLVKIPLMAVGSPVGSIGTIQVTVGGGGTCVVSTGSSGNNGGAGNPSSITFNFPFDTSLALHGFVIDAKGGSGGIGGKLSGDSAGGAGGLASTIALTALTPFYKNTRGGNGGRSNVAGENSLVAYPTAGNLVSMCYASGAGGGGGGSWNGTVSLSNAIGGFSIYDNSPLLPSIFSRANTLINQFFTPISPSIGGNGVNGSAQSSVAATTCPDATVGGGGGGGGSSKVSSKGGSGGNGVVYIMEYYDPLYAGTVF